MGGRDTAGPDGILDTSGATRGLTTTHGATAATPSRNETPRGLSRDENPGVAAMPPDDVTPVFRLLYRSHDLVDPCLRRTELGSLFSISRSRNKRLGVTGALLLAEDHFVQALEGREHVVRALFEHIAGDPRHDEVELIEITTSSPRVFARWAMAEVGLGGAADVALIAHADGITPSAGHRFTPEQTTVLNTMRAVVVGAPAGRC